MPLMEIRVFPDDVATVPEAAKKLGKPKVTLYRWIEADKILYVRFGGILFIPTSEIERLKKTETGAAEAPVSPGGPRVQVG